MTRPGGGWGLPLLGLALLGAWGLGAGPARAAEAGSLPPASAEPAPPEPPRAGDQLPAPVPPSAPTEREPPVTVGASFVVALRPGTVDGVSYEPALGYAGWARLEVAPWLGWRLGAEWTRHAVTVEPGALGLAGTTVEQPELRVVKLDTRVEPTWVLSPEVRAWAGLGLGWARAVAPPPTTRGDLQLISAQRTGVHLEWALALGVGFRPGPRWLELGAELGAALTSNASGTLHDHRLQGFDVTSGTRHGIDPLPPLGTRWGGALWVGVRP